MKWTQVLLGRRALSVYAVVLLMAAFLLNVSRIVKIGMVQAPAAWAVDAIPPAVSELYYGNKVRYTNLTEVSAFFYKQLGLNPIMYQTREGKSLSAKQINPIITQLVERSKHHGPVSTTYGLMETGDDKGIVDFVEVSFLLFGPHVESLTYLYLLLLAGSVLLYVLAFAGSPGRLFIVTAYLGALYLLIPSIVHNPQLGSLLALRAFPLLSMVATLHCVLAALFPGSRFSAGKFALCACQLLFVFFVYHIRITTLWQLQIIVFAVGLTLVFRLYRWMSRWRQDPLSHASGEKRKPTYVFVLGLGALVMVGFLGLALYRHAFYPREYREQGQTVTRVFWHNIYSGFAFSPKLARKEGLRIDDHSIIRATANYLKRCHRDGEWQKICGPMGLRWADYEKVVREMVMRQLRRHPFEVVAGVLYWKPRSVLGHMLWLWGARRG